MIVLVLSITEKTEGKTLEQVEVVIAMVEH